MYTSGHRLVLPKEKNLRLSKLTVYGIFLLAGLAQGSVASAARTGHLYSAEVPVSEKSAEEKTRAASEALLQVLVKLTGNRRIGQNPVATGMLQTAEDFVQQYRYTPNSTMLFGFDGRNLQEALRQAQLPVWGADRPATLVWLAVDDGAGDRQLLSADDQGEVRSQVETVAAERGIPLVWPLNDSIDRSQVTAADVWGGYSENVDKASMRYGADAILVARISRGSNGAFFGNWHLQLLDEKQEWRGGLNSSVHRLADFYASRLASVAGADGDEMVRMLVSGLENGRAYARVLGAIEKLSTVERVQVLQAVGDTVSLELTLRGDREQLRRLLGFSRVLEVQPQTDASDTLLYRYLR